MSPEVRKTISKQDPKIDDHSPLKVDGLIQLWQRSQGDKNLLPTFLAELARSASNLTEEDVKKLEEEVKRSEIKIKQE